MRHETVNQMFQRYHEHKAKGIKHTPLHTLQECCEEAGIYPGLFGRYAAQFPNAPQPVLQHAKNVGRGAVKYYRKNEFVQWVNQVRQQKEKAMPDIKTALEKALAQTANEWAADDESHQEIKQQEKTVTVSVTDTAGTLTDKRITSNVSRGTFYFIRDNAGLTAQEVITQLMAQGYKATSVTSLIGQMLRTRMLMEDANGGLTATIKEYIPIQAKPGKTSKPTARKPAAPVQQRKRVEIVNTRTGEVFNPKPAPVATPAEWTVDSAIGSLSVRQALAVYMELKQLFGE